MMFTNTQTLYVGLCLLALKGIEVVKRGVYFISISISFLLVFKNTWSLYDGIDLQALAWEVVLGRLGCIPYSSPYELYSQIHRH